MKIRDKVAARKWVAHVDDERSEGGAILITLKDGYFFADERDCGVRGFDTWVEAENETRKDAVFHKTA